MLKIVEGRSVAAWQPSDTEQADVLIAHISADPAVLNAWGRTGKPMVMVVDTHEAWPSSAQFVLRYPFRIMQLLTLLDDLAGHLGATQSIPMEGDSAACGAGLLSGVFPSFPT